MTANALLYVVILLVAWGMFNALQAQDGVSVDTAITRLSSDTVVTAVDSTVVDSVAIIVMRPDTVGWNPVYQITPGSRVVTDMWRFVLTSLLMCAACDGGPVDTLTPPPVDEPPADSTPPIDTVPPPPPVDSTPPPPPPPPPGGTDLTLDFDDPNNLGVTCGSGVCNWPYRKHDYWPTGGVNGSGAINMHWSPNMVVGSSPVYVRTGSTARHFRISYRVKQSAIMSTSGSRQKMMRLWSDGNPFRAVGMLENTRGNLCWHWEGWDTRPLSSCVGIGQGTFNDDQWHTYTIEVDYRNTADFVVTLSFDGVVGRTLHLDARAAGNLYNGLLIVSPMVEMFSCGVVSGPCGAGNPTVAGDYTVDDFSFTILQ